MPTNTTASFFSYPTASNTATLAARQAAWALKFAGDGTMFRPGQFNSFVSNLLSGFASCVASVWSADPTGLTTDQRLAAMGPAAQKTFQLCSLLTSTFTNAAVIMQNPNLAASLPILPTSAAKVTFNPDGTPATWTGV